MVARGPSRDALREGFGMRGSPVVAPSTSPVCLRPRESSPAAQWGSPAASGDAPMPRWQILLACLLSAKGANHPSLGQRPRNRGQPRTSPGRGLKARVMHATLLFPTPGSRTRRGACMERAFSPSPDLGVFPGSLGRWPRLGWFAPLALEADWESTMAGWNAALDAGKRDESKASEGDDEAAS